MCPRHTIATIAGTLAAFAILLLPSTTNAALPSGTNAFPATVFSQTASGTFSDLTTAASNETPEDITLVPQSPGALFIGAESPFDRLSIVVAVPGVGGTAHWEYWNGGTWTSTTAREDLLVAGQRELTWSLPASWVASDMNGTRAFWMRVRVGTAYTTKPVGSTIALRAYNAYLEAVDALGAPMRWGNTIVISRDLRLSSCGEATAPIASIDLSSFSSGGSVSAPGTFALALPNTVYQQPCTITLTPSGFIPQSRSFGPRQRTTVGRENIRAVFEYPLVVSLVTDEDGNAASGVTFLGRAPAATTTSNPPSYSFKATPGEHGQLEAGGGPYAYASDPTSGNTQLADVAIGVTAPTVVRFEGTAPCAAGNTIATGAAVRCRSLLRSLAVTVVDAATNAPVRDATIRVHTNPTDASSPLASDTSANRGQAEQRSNVNGYASFGLRAGSYGIEIRKDPYPVQALINVRVSDDTRTAQQITLTMAPPPPPATAAPPATVAPTAEPTPTPTPSTPPVTSDPPTTTPPATTPPASTPPAVETYTTGDLVALACPADAGVNHPCRAVYEIGADGKRHAFPHFQVFLTWYSETQLRRTTAGGRVKTIDSAALSSFSLGALMGVRPNSRLVKFISVPVVYAVDASGALRPIPDETTAARWYGANWATKVLDLSDAFFTNYRIGEPLR